MKKYIYQVCLCDGKYCDGSIGFVADNEEQAYEDAMYYVCKRLSDALPELGVEVYLNLIAVENI